MITVPLVSLVMYRLKNTYRFIALTMAFLMLFTSVGFSMDLHYCQGHLKSVSLIGKAKNCHELQAQSTSDHCKKAKSSCKHSGEKISQKEADGCCNNKTVKMDDLDEDYFFSGYNLEDNSLNFVAINVSHKISDDLVIDYDVDAYLHYKPPEPYKDFQSYFQVFII